MTLPVYLVDDDDAVRKALILLLSTVGIKAKGFADCLCFLQSGRADLTVMTSGDALTAAQVAQIRDIVLSKSEVTAQNITVVEVK